MKWIDTPVTYSEEYWEASGKFIGKTWRAKGKLRSESIDEFDGKVNTMIFRQDSAKGYVLDMEKKTWKAVPFSMLAGGIKSATNNVTGLDIVTAGKTERKFIKTEVVEGYECELYEIKTTSTTKDGGQHVDYWVNEWFYKPYNMWIRLKELPYEPAKVRRNIKTSPQPDNLFEIPKDFKGMTLPAGGLMEILTGKSKSENQKAVDDAQKRMDEFEQKLKELEKSTEGKSEAEKRQETIKMLEGLNKKK
jgi:hypothetical protein